MRSDLKGRQTVNRFIEGNLNGEGKKVGVVVSRFNDFVTGKLLEGALSKLKDQGVKETDIAVAWVPGSFELPVAAKKMAGSGRYDAVICLGALIRGETPHFEYIAQAASYGIAEAGLASGIPVIFGVLTTENMDQAMDRVGGKTGHKGEEAALSAIEMANLIEKI